MLDRFLPALLFQSVAVKHRLSLRHPLPLKSRIPRQPLHAGGMGNVAHSREARAGSARAG